MRVCCAGDSCRHGEADGPRQGLIGRPAGWGSNAMPNGALRELPVITVAGAGSPLAAIWAGVNSTTELFSIFAIQRSPLPSDANPAGPSSDPAFAVSTMAGVIVPDVVS